MLCVHLRLLGNKAHYARVLTLQPDRNLQPPPTYTTHHHRARQHTIYRQVCLRLQPFMSVGMRYWKRGLTCTGAALSPSCDLRSPMTFHGLAPARSSLFTKARRGTEYLTQHSHAHGQTGRESGMRRLTPSLMIDSECQCTLCPSNCGPSVPPSARTSSSACPR